MAEELYDEQSFMYHEVVHAAEFFSFYDKDFITQVYLRLLKREPDPIGFGEFLAQIRSGETRYSIIEAISNSPEGRKSGVRLEGMDGYKRFKKIQAIPVIGTLFAIAMILSKSKALIKDLRALENHIYRMSVSTHSSSDE